MVRVAAADALGDIGAPRGAEALRKALGDKTAEVKGAAAVALGKMGDCCVVPALIGLLGDPKAGVREVAAGLLERLGEPVGALAMRALAGNAEAMAQLAIGRDRRTVEPLIGLLGDSSHEVREVAARVLEASGEPLGRLFCEALHIGGQAIQVMVEARDVRVVPPLIHTLQSPEVLVRRNAAITLDRFGDRRALYPLLALFCWDEEVDVRDAARDALVAHREAAIPLLQRILIQGRGDARLAAAEALGRIAHSDAVAALVEGLADSEVRQASARALVLQGEPLGCLVVSALAGDQQAFDLLRGRSDRRMYSPLVRVMQWDRDPTVRRIAMELAAEVARRHEWRDFECGLRDPDETVRMAAAEVLGRLGCWRATVPLIYALGDSSGRVRRKVAETLERVGKPLFGRLVCDFLDGRWDAFEGLEDGSRLELLMYLCRVLESRTPEVRDRAAEGIADLWRGLEGRIDRFVCVEHGLRFSEHVRQVEGSAKYPEVRYGACRRCADLGPASQINEMDLRLGRGVRHWDWRKRQLTVIWPTGCGLFDFDRVEISGAREEEVRLFIEKVRQDKDPIRRRRYRTVPCKIAPGPPLGEDVLDRLAETFGPVEVRPLPE
jgi:HEAT repeat protein